MPKTSQKKLTKKLLDSLKPLEGKDYSVWDNEVAGFGVRVKSSGRRSFQIKYRTENGRQRKTTLGSYGQLTAEQARRLAKIELGQVAAGQDPAAKRIKKKQAQTITQLCDRYLQDAISGRILYRGKAKSSSTIKTDTGRIQRHLKPLLGARRIDSLKRSDVENFMFAVRDGKTAIRERTGFRGVANVKGGMGTAKKAVSLLSSIYRYAIKQGLAEYNPCQYIELPADNKRTRFLNAEEYKRLGNALRAISETTSYDRACEAILALTLTGCRRQEILNLKLREVDKEGRCLRLEETKTGAQIRPCGKAAFDIFDNAVREYKSEYIFPSKRNSGPLVNIRIPMKLVCEKAGLEGVTPHTLRHSYATVAHELGYSELTIAGLLGHRLNSVTSRYAHHVDHVLADAADKVSNIIIERMS